ncbi:MAG: type I DNA topoisomerase [Actinomycetaceae bacterium]|nr:type I DNA topoisomerase [Actinomycetaceae bacterium]
MKLVIVESPSKARTISQFLGKDYTVLASVGHIRDLAQPSDLPEDMKKGPYGRFAVNVENEFEAYYVISSGKKKTVSDLKRALKNADELLLATDEDREGEAIAWHLLEVLKPKVPVKRLVFHEITKKAIEDSLTSARDVDMKMVDAQESRRILDRLVGYQVSPLLWRKVAPKTSAGRVQSAATRLIVERERERIKFVSADYAGVVASFAKETEIFDATLTHVGNERVATGKDFNDEGVLAKKNCVHVQADIAGDIANYVAKSKARVVSVESKPHTRRPYPPFTTSTLQQAAGNVLHLSSRDTMRLAQYLYENGYITYMRTDSVALSQQAIDCARKDIADTYGEKYLTEKPRIYANKQKGAQEAHEAIRPAGENFKRPQDVRHQLSNDQYRLYELIYKRTLASQMVDETGKVLSLKLLVEGVPHVETAQFSASGTIVEFPGWRRIYGVLAASEVSATDSNDDVQNSERASLGEDAFNVEGEKKKNTSAAALLNMSEGDVLEALSATAQVHTTKPPARYTEASLVKKMEELGIGRPSTYASTISTIVNRGYVGHKGSALVPTWNAFFVTGFLEEHLPRLVDYDFTAKMEEDLDLIAAGNEGRVEYLRRFWDGDGKVPGLEKRVDALIESDVYYSNNINLGNNIILRNGRYGAYLQELDEKGDEKRHASVPVDVLPDELDIAKAYEILDTVGADERVLGIDTETGRTIFAKVGRYGPYVSEVIGEDEVLLTKTGKVSKRKPKARVASLFKTMDIESISLDAALMLLSQPREVGVTSDGYVIKAQNGRFGPYLTKELLDVPKGEKAPKPETRSLKEEEKIFTITLEECEELYAQPKGRRGRASAAPLKELGKDPVTNSDVVVKDGRYGMYITDGETNVTLPKDESVDSLTAEKAYALLAEKREKAPARPRKKRATAKKTTRKKAAS